jgi:hypothetical protein
MTTYMFQGVTIVHYSKQGAKASTLHIHYSKQGADGTYSIISCLSYCPPNLLKQAILRIETEITYIPRDEIEET